MKTAAAFAAGLATGFLGGKYLVYGPESEERRRKMGEFMRAVETDIRDKMRRAGTMTEEAYRVIVDEVTDGYAGIHRISKDKARRIADTLKARYREMETLVQETADDAREEAADEDLMR